MTDATTKPTIVLVHGAWADGSSWDGVTRALQAQGYTVLVPPNLLRGLTDDAAYIASFLAQRTSGPVVLVGHSYGGAVITNAGAARRRACPRLRQRVHARRGRDRGADPRGIELGTGRRRPDDDLRHRGLSGRARGCRRSVPQARRRALVVRAGPPRGRPLDDRRQPAPGIARGECHALWCARVEDAAELGGHRHRRSGHSGRRAAPHGRARRVDRVGTRRRRTCRWCRIPKPRSTRSSQRPTRSDRGRRTSRPHAHPGWRERALGVSCGSNVCSKSW